MHHIHESIEDLAVSISTLSPYHKNPRRGNVDRLAESLEVNGQYRPIVVNRRTLEVLAGNHTMKAAQQLGWDKIAATFVDVDEHDAARIVLVDNRSNDLADYDDLALAEVLQGLDELEGTGYTTDDLEGLLSDLAADIDDAYDADDDDFDDADPFDEPWRVECPACGHAFDPRNPEGGDDK